MKASGQIQVKDARFLIMFFLLWTSHVISQNNIWYFGDKAGINFNSNPPTVLTNSQMFAPEGTSVISDKNGALLFYTDGVTVWNRNHAIMFNGTGLMGNPSTTQGALIVPNPGDTSEYFVFTIDQLAGSNGMRYSKVDMSLQSGLGGVTSKNVPFHPSVAEKMVALRRCDGSIWIISHEWNSSKFFADLLTPTGFNSTVVSTAGSVHSGGGQGVINSVGHMAISQQGDRLAVAMRDASTFEVLNFNATTGVVSNPITLNNFRYYRSYGVAFSPDGSKLYGSCINSGNVFQFDLSYTSAASMIANDVQVGSMTNLGGGMKLGPNGKIYVARSVGATSGVLYMGVINSPNSLGTACGFVSNGIYLGGKRSLLGVPSIFVDYLQAQNPLSIAGDTAICAGDTANLSAISPGNIVWVQGATSTIKNIKVVPNVTTTYRVAKASTSPTSLCDDTASIKVSVYNRPNLSISAVDTFLCVGESTTLAVVGSNDVQWISGINSTSSSILISPSVTTTYKVINSKGPLACRDTASITIHVNAIPNITLIGDTLVCVGDTGVISVLGSNNVQWVQGSSSTSPTIFVTPSTTTDYKVVNMNTPVNCRDTLSFKVKVASFQQLTIAATDTFLCQGDATALQVNSSSGVQWISGSGATSNTLTVSPSSTTVYKVYNTNVPPSCSDTAEITITVEPIQNITVNGDSSICQGDTTVLTVSGSNNIMWVAGASSTTNTIRVAPLITTNYKVVNMNVAQECRDTIIFKVNVNPYQQLSIAASDTFICPGDTVYLSANGASSLQWISGSSSNSATLAETPLNTTTYRVYNTNTSSKCSDTASVVVTVGAEQGIGVIGDSIICLGDSSLLTVVGSSNVQWFGSMNSTSSSVFVKPTSTTVYKVVNLNSSPECRDTVKYLIRVSDDPTVNIVASDTILCPGDSITLSLSGPGASGSIQWSGGIISNNPSIKVAPTSNTTYFVSSGSSKCSGGDTISITVVTGLNANINGIASICNLEYDFTALALGAETYNWDFGDGTSSVGAQVTHQFQGPGKYRVHLKASKLSCNLQDTVSLLVDVVDTLNEPEILFTDQGDCQTGDIDFQVKHPNIRYQYLWMFGNGMNSSASVSKVKYSKEGVYKVRLSIQDTLCNTFYEDSVLVDIDQIEAKVFIPNAFTPNGDGLNEKFFISGNSCDENERLEIYNRWGALIYSTDQPFLEFWDGTFKGKESQEDVYVYILVTGDEVRHGYISLIR